MKYYLESNPKDLIELKEEMVVGEPGFDGKVYKRGNKAIKLLHISKKIPSMTEKKAKLFKNKLNLRSFVGIDDILYNENNEYAGYSMKYEKEDYGKTIKMHKNNFLKNISDLLADVDQFSKINCYIKDLAQFDYFANCICNDYIRPIDMDNYILVKSMNYDELHDSNLNSIRKLLIQIFTILYEIKIFELNDVDDNIINKIHLSAISDLDFKLDKENILDYFKQELNNYDTLDKYFESKIGDIKNKIIKRYNK